MNPLTRTHRWPLLRPAARSRLRKASGTVNCSMLFHGPSPRPLLIPSNRFDFDSTHSYHGSTWCASRSFQASPMIQSPEDTLDELEIKAASAPSLWIQWVHTHWCMNLLPRWAEINRGATASISKMLRNSRSRCSLHRWRISTGTSENPANGGWSGEKQRSDPTPPAAPSPSEYEMTCLASLTSTRKALG